MTGADRRAMLGPTMPMPGRIGSFGRLLAFLRISALLASLALPTALGALQSSRSNTRDVLELGWNGVVRQTFPNSCGPAVLATLLAMQGVVVSEEEISSRTELGPNGLNLAQFAQLSRELGMPGRWLRFGYSFDAATLPTPSIVHLSSATGHFAILRRDGNEFMQLADPARGEILVPRAQFLREWTKRLFVFDVPLAG